MEQLDDLGVRRAVGRPRVLFAQRRPPLLLGPALERSRVRGGQQIARDPRIVGDDQCQIRLSDDIRPNEHVPEQVGVAVDRGRVAAGIAGQQAHPIGSGQVTHRSGADRRASARR